MNIITTSTGITANIILFEHIDFYSFADEFEEFLEKNPNILSLPLYVQFKKDITGSIPEVSIFIDSLKDMNVFISGIITENKGLQRFASYLSIPNFSSLQLIDVNRAKPATAETAAVTSASASPTVPVPQLSAQQQKNLNTTQLQQDQAYQTFGESLYKPSNDSNMNPISAPTPQPQTVKAPSQQAVIEVDPYENQGLTQPDKEPLIIQENITTNTNVKHDGDIIILGEVDAGAIVSATGSIHCYKPANGILLAGSSGNSKARIYAIHLNAEAVALAGFYAKRHQYKHVLHQSNLMISLHKSNLNFNVIAQLPSVVTLSQIEKKQNAAANADENLAKQMTMEEIPPVLSSLDEIKEDATTSQSSQDIINKDKTTWSNDITPPLGIS